MLTPESLHACCWSTIGLRRADLAPIEAQVSARHPGHSILRSCQRTEAYGLEPCDCDAPVHLAGREALEHLGEVAAGLHSVVLGEPQVLGQARTAFEAARGPVKALAEVALLAARDIRRTTDFNSHAGALLDRALRIAGRPGGGSLLVLGAGEMARLVVERAPANGFDSVVVAARRAPVKIGAPFVPLAGLANAGRFEVVVGCLGSGAPELGPEDLPGAGLLVDLGTPPNFGPGQGATVVTLADLMADETARPHARKRREELKAELHVALGSRLAERTLDGTSAVGQLRARVEQLRTREAARAQKLHPEIPAETIETLTKALVNQLFHPASTRLKQADEDFGRRVAELFAAP